MMLAFAFGGDELELCVCFHFCKRQILERSVRSKVRTYTLYSKHARHETREHTNRGGVSDPGPLWLYKQMRICIWGVVSDKYFFLNPHRYIKNILDQIPNKKEFIV